jgi:hypothetical protein
LDVYGYLTQEHRGFAMQQMMATNAIEFFLPLLHELFNGSEAKSKVLFAVLHGLMTDDRVRWSRAELDEKYHWLNFRQRHYLLHRLSSVGWLDYYRDSSAYMISDKGEALMRVLSRFTMGADLVQNEGAALAEIEFSLLLDVHDLNDRLSFLRSRLQKLVIRAETALDSESAYLILEIYQQLKSAYRWAEQTRTTLDSIEPEDDDDRIWNEIREIHDHLSLLHSLISRMQLELQDIQRKQIDIAQYGLTHLDFDNFLMNADVDSLAGLMKEFLRKVPHPLFLQETTAFMEAQAVINRDGGPDGPMRGWDTDVAEAASGGEPTPAREAVAFTKQLSRLTTKWRDVGKLVGDEGWEVAAYRFSLLTLLADRKQMPENTYDPFITLPVEAEFDPSGELIQVPHGDGTLEMTKGRVRRQDEQ